MTYSSDLLDHNAEVTGTFIAAPQYPSMFGITLSPMVIGAAVGLLGLGVSAYVYASYLQPQLAKNQELSAKLADTEGQIKQRQDVTQKIAQATADRDKLKAQQEQIVGLFANDRKLDTLLLDLNKLVNIRQGQLQRFEPESSATVVKDGAFGAALDGKLKRKSVSIALEGNFEQVQSILRTIERLDQLLIVKDFRADVDKSGQKIVIDHTGKIVSGPISEPKLKTTLKLQAIIPTTPEERAAAAPPPAPAKK
jgi:type IV pilus assembly protein PilO